MILGRFARINVKLLHLNIKLYFQIKLFCFHPVHKKQCESKLEVHRDTTLRESIEISWKVICQYSHVLGNIIYVYLKGKAGFLI